MRYVILALLIWWSYTSIKDLVQTYRRGGDADEVNTATLFWVAIITISLVLLFLFITIEFW